MLKENNLRIFFEDTSISPGFPPNDWRLIANDSASGGSNFFAIEDATAARQVFRVDAGAPANSLRVRTPAMSASGPRRPVLDLSINTSDTPATRLEQNNSGGFTAQTWDIGGNEANFFVRDVTGGSRLSFRIRPGAPTSSLDIAATAMSASEPRARTTVPSAPASTSSATGNPDPRFTNSRSGTAQHRRRQLIALQQTRNFFTTTTERPATFGFLTGGHRNVMRHRSRTATSASGRTSAGGAASYDRNRSLCAAFRLQRWPSNQWRRRRAPVCLSSRQFKHVAGELRPDVALANVMALRPQIGAYKDTPDVAGALADRRRGGGRSIRHWSASRTVEPYTVKIQEVVTDLVAVIQQQQRRIEALERAIAR